jgi:hypothetical protein
MVTFNWCQTYPLGLKNHTEKKEGEVQIGSLPFLS